MALNWWRGFETNADRFLHQRYEARVLALQISAAIICKFESNKQTKHNLFGPHSQISLHRFLVCTPSRQFPFPVRWAECIVIWWICIRLSTRFPRFFPVFFVISEPGKCVLCGSQQPARWGSGNIVSLEIGLS